MKTSLLKVAVVGPESTGKSTIAQQLSTYFGTVCVPEYARYYCQDLHQQYTLTDEVNMFYGQCALQEAILPLANNNILICDTTILTVKIWCDHLFGHTPEKVLQAISRLQYDLYLLMDIDLPWQDDPLRDFPEQREHFLKVWKKELTDLSANYRLISGTGPERTKRAIAAIENYRAELI